MSERVLPHELLARLAKPGLVPTPSQDEHMQKLSGMCWFFFRARVESFLRTHSDKPISVSYQSDCTPSTTQETIVATLGDERIVRTGARSAEYLLHRLFARASGHEHAVLFGPPDHLQDKTVSTHVRASRKYILYPFRFGSRTINISHVVFDGALWDPLSRALFSDHAMAIDAECASSDDADPSMMKLLCWFARTPCMLHSCHNALKWGLQPW
jgi:hypothetical protein